MFNSCDVRIIEKGNLLPLTVQLWWRVREALFTMGTAILKGNKYRRDSDRKSELPFVPKQDCGDI